MRTNFKDEINNIHVELVNWSDVDRTERTIVNVSNAYHIPKITDTLSKKDIKKKIIETFNEETLPLGLEMMNFTFLIKNVSLTITHCIVRHRIGMTFSQRSTAVSDLRDDDILVPRSFMKISGFYDRYRNWIILGKKLYCELVDSNKVSIQDARVLLPKNHSQWIYVHCNFLSLKNFIGKRLCNQEEPIQLNIIAAKMRELACDKYPYLRPYLKSNCEMGRCFHQKRGAHNNIVFKRNAQHSINKNYDEKEDTLHNFTRDEGIGNSLVKEYYEADENDCY